VKSPQRIFIHY